MLVAIEDKIYTPAESRVMLILSDKDKENIASMSKEANCFASFPEGNDIADIADWMEKMKLEAAKEVEKNDVSKLPDDKKSEST